MKYILIIAILYGIWGIAGFIDDWLVLRGFKIALKKYNELYPNYNIPIPKKYKELRALKQSFEDFTCYNDLLHYHLTITNFHYDEEGGGTIMKCHICKRDINVIGQDNVSYIPGIPICEDCYSELSESDWKKLEIEAEKENEDTFCTYRN